MTAVELALVSVWILYLSVAAMLNSSLGLRMGYDMFRIIPVSLVWPLLYVGRVDEWAKQGQCTLPEDHPLRTD